jgi:hypothetical protein
MVGAAREVRAFAHPTHLVEGGVSFRGQRTRKGRIGDPALFVRHCEPTGRANARPMTGSAKQSIAPQKGRWIASSLRSSQ